MCLAVPGRIISITGAALSRSGRVAFGNVVREVSLACVPDAAIGSYVLVHAGIAIAIVDEREAERTLEALATLETPQPTSPRAPGAA